MIFTDIDAVIFDLDGTLVDSMWMWRSIDIEYLARFGIEMPLNLQECIEGMSFSETAVYFKQRFQLKDSLEQIKSAWNEMAWDKYLNKVPLKEGVIELLKYLKKINIPAGIATSNSRELTELIIKRHGITEYFTSIRTSCEVLKGKPSPDIYLLVAKDLGVQPERCLVFEDIIQGIMAGRNAHMRVCAVYDEYSEKYTDEKIKLSDHYVKSLKDLLKDDLCDSFQHL
jgi:HAD superfamily hydrolase (TIGR01509 family)